MKVAVIGGTGLIATRFDDWLVDNGLAPVR